MYILDFVPTIIKIDQQDMPLFGQERKLGKGTDGVTKTDEFSEKFLTAFDPPLIFGKSCCAFRDKIATKVRMFRIAGLLCII